MPISFVVDQGKSPSKRKTFSKEPFVLNKKVKTELSPSEVSKKPIRLKKTKHPRKKLQSNRNKVVGG